MPTARMSRMLRLLPRSPCPRASSQTSWKNSKKNFRRQRQSADRNPKELCRPALRSHSARCAVGMRLHHLPQILFDLVQSRHVPHILVIFDFKPYPWSNRRRRFLNQNTEFGDQVWGLFHEQIRNTGVYEWIPSYGFFSGFTQVPLLPDVTAQIVFHKGPPILLVLRSEA